MLYCEFPEISHCSSSWHHIVDHDGCGQGAPTDHVENVRCEKGTTLALSPLLLDSGKVNLDQKQNFKPSQRFFNNQIPPLRFGSHHFSDPRPSPMHHDFYIPRPGPSNFLLCCFLPPVDSVPMSISIHSGRFPQSRFVPRSFDFRMKPPRTTETQSFSSLPPG